MKRRRRSRNSDGSIGGDFWAGYSDLMAGVLLIFIVVSALKDVQLVQRFAKPSESLNKWHDALEALCSDRELTDRHLAPDCRTGTIELDEGVFFDFDKVTLKEAGKENLRGAVPIILAKLRQHVEVWKQLQVEVRGHADPVAQNVDPYRVNLEKSAERAQSVLLFLTHDDKINPEDRSDLKRLSIASGAAAERPPVDCIEKSKQCYARMRRVEIHLHLDDVRVQSDLVDLLDQLLKS